MMKRILYDFCSSLNVFYYLYKLNQYRENLFLNEDALKKLQLQKLKILIRYAYQKVHYYRKLFDSAGIKPEGINSLEDLHKIPITTKEALRALSTNQIISSGTRIACCTNLRTSGSTGEPLDIFIDKNDELIRRISLMRIYLENGRRIKDKALIIITPSLFLRKRWFHPVLYRLNFFQEKHISIHEDKNSILKTIDDYQPDIIHSYPSIIKELARIIREKNIRGISARTIFLTGEMLTAEDRRYISSVFNAEVFSYYASNECGPIAWECSEHSGYHINSDHAIVEFIKGDGESARAGEEGEIVLTSLNSYTMPFIRYRIKDIGILSDEKCPCGRTPPLMKMLIGRVNDYIVLPNGKKISPYMLMIIMDRISEIKRYQIIQEDKNKIKISILRNAMITNETISKIRKNYKESLGTNIEIEPVVVDNISKGEAGEFKVIISKVSDNDN